MTKKHGGDRNNTFIYGSEICLRRIIESQEDIILFTLDREYRYTSYSKAHSDTMKKIWGKEIALGMSILEIVSTHEDREKALSNFNKALKGETLMLREEFGDSALNRRFWEDRYYPLKDDAGEIIGITVIAADVTDLVMQEKMLIQSVFEKEILRQRELLLDSIGEGLYGVDMNGNCIFVNPAALGMLGYTEEEFLGKNSHELIHHHHIDGNTYTKEECIIHKVTLNETKDETRTWLFRKSGEMFPVRIIASPMIKDGELDGIVIAFSDISTQYEMEEKLRHTNNELKVLATQDPLTEIYNRRYFEERGSGLFISSTVSGSPLALIMFDIDFFKKVNDKYGHSVGDLVLIMVTETVKTQLRKWDIFARIGGEEFVILLPDIGLEKAAEIAERIRQKVQQASIVQNGDTISVTISIGVADVRPSDEDIYGLLQRADDRQYAAKKSGRNKVIFSD